MQVLLIVRLHLSLDAVVRGTQNSPLPPSVETAYYRKCIELKRRINEIEESNDAARVRKIRVNRQVLKMRLERAFLLENLQKRMDFNLDDSDRSTSPPPTVRARQGHTPQDGRQTDNLLQPQEKPLRSKRGHRKTTPPPPGGSVAPQETPGSTTGPASGQPGQGYFDAAPGTQAPLPAPQLTPGQSQPSASPYPPIQPQPAPSSPSAPPSNAFANGQPLNEPSVMSQTSAKYDEMDDDERRNADIQERDGEATANGEAVPSTTTAADATSGASATEEAAGADGNAAGGFTAVNR